MIIEETFLSREFTFETANPYKTALEIEDRLKNLGNFIERKNTYETDGPDHRVVVVFDIVTKIDEYSKIMVFVELFGNKTTESTKGTITVKTSFILKTEINEYGTVSQAFGEYYVSKFFSRAKKKAEKHTENTIKIMDAFVKDTQK